MSHKFYSDNENSEEFESILKSYENNLVQQLRNSSNQHQIYTFRDQESLCLSSILYYRFDLLNQASIGLMDFINKFASNSIGIQVMAQFDLKTETKKTIRYKMNLFQDIELKVNDYRLGQVCKKIRVASPTLKDAIEVCLQYNKKLYYSDYEFIGLAFDLTGSRKFKWIRQNDELSLLNLKASRNLVIFNTNSEKVAHEHTIRILLITGLPDEVEFLN